MTSSDEEVERQLVSLAGRPADERAEYLIRVGDERAGRPTPGVLPFLEDPEPMVRTAAVQARWQTEHRPAELDRLVGVLAEVLCGEDPELALMAGTALGNIGRPAVPPLVERSETLGQREPLIVRVVGEIGGPEALAFLRRTVRSEREDVAEEAREALEELAREAESAGEPPGGWSPNDGRA